MTFAPCHDDGGVVVKHQKTKGSLFVRVSLDNCDAFYQLLSAGHWDVRACRDLRQPPAGRLVSPRRRTRSSAIRDRDHGRPSRFRRYLVITGSCDGGQTTRSIFAWRGDGFHSSGSGNADAQRDAGYPFHHHAPGAEAHQTRRAGSAVRRTSSSSNTT